MVVKHPEEEKEAESRARVWPMANNHDSICTEPNGAHTSLAEDARNRQSFVQPNCSLSSHIELSSLTVDDSTTTSGIDYVLVYKQKSKRSKKANNREQFLKNLCANGLEYETLLDDSKLLAYVLIRVPTRKCIELLRRTTNRWWRHDMRSRLHTSSVSATDRCLFAYEIMSRTSFNRTEPNVGIEHLLANRTFLAAYPLHQDLWENWARPSNWLNRQPLARVRDYFGEKLAFYFAWLGFYTTWLVLPALVGVLIFIYGCATMTSDLPTRLNSPERQSTVHADVTSLTTAQTTNSNQICDPHLGGNLTMCLPCDKRTGVCKVELLSDSCIYSKITYIVDNPLTVFFSVFMAVWTVLFIEFWKREQCQLDFKWNGRIDDPHHPKWQPTRPQFEVLVKTKRLNKATGVVEPFVPLWSSIVRYAFSFGMVVIMILLVLALLAGMIVYRISLPVVFASVFRYDDGILRLITSASAAWINLLVIIVFSRFYSWLAEKLTNIERHRTDVEHEKSLAIKMYMFQFVNFYASIFYIAFFKGRFNLSLFGFTLNVEPCNQSGCLSELCIQLAIIMVGKQILNNIQEVLFPLALNYWKRWSAKRGGIDADNSVSATAAAANMSRQRRCAADNLLLDWDHLTLFYEYLEMVIQFGFITLFAVAFPLGPLFALLNNVLEVRIDANKVLTQYKRPLPRRAHDIGIWLHILTTISKIGVITNGMIIAFTTEFIPRLVYNFLAEQERRTADGYVHYTLSPSSTVVNGTHVDCFIKGFQGDDANGNNGQSSTSKNKIYLYILIARFIFLFLFEHVVFLIVIVLQWIPDVPKKIRDQIEYQQLYDQAELYQMKSFNSSSFSHICSSNNNNNNNNKNNSRSTAGNSNCVSSPFLFDIKLLAGQQKFSRDKTGPAYNNESTDAE